MKLTSFCAALLLLGILTCDTWANDILFQEPSAAAEGQYLAPSPAIGPSQMSPWPAGAPEASGGYDSIGAQSGPDCNHCGNGGGCTWGCCDRPCSPNLHLWDGYCEEKDHSSWSLGSCGANGSNCSRCN